ncbi:MAG TPA: isoprenylcysteine carboxylmethyltransferase family protein [Terriglobales bacterium]|nr:isoprenylcysteine carboxylmethyltransferase family protein [Terriglobales bacterium]
MGNWSETARRIRVPTGFAFAVVYGWLAHPNRSSLLWGALLILAGLGIRGFASGYLQKNEELATAGPYAYTRNPLYLGSLVIAAGFTIAARSLWIAGILLVLFVAIYWPVIRAEESYLSERFPEFLEYRSQVPRLIPKPTRYLRKPAAFSWQLYLKHREYNATLGSLALLAALLAKLLWTSS